MPQVTVHLSDAQAGILDMRARAARQPSDEFLRDIVASALGADVGEGNEVDEAAIDRAFAIFADAYPDICDELFTSDLDLRIE